MDFDDQFLTVMDSSNGFWFLPGGGLEQDESIHVTLASRETREQLKIPPLIAVHATPIRGQLKAKYAPRKIILIKKKHCKSLLHDFKIPKKYECMKPYHYISKEVIR